MNILLINPGRREYLVKYFLDLSTKYKSKIFIIDSNKFIPSFLVSKETRNFVSPKCRKKSNFQSFLRNFVKKNKIKIIFPLSEHELKILATEKSFYDKLNVKIIVSDSKVIDICQNKIKTFNFLKKFKINTPNIYKLSNIKHHLPVIMKRVDGYSSRDQRIIDNKKLIPSKLDKKFFFQKYYNFQEYGMDILNDLKGNFIHCTVRKKISIRAGDTDSAIIINPKKFIKLAHLISKNLRHNANLDVDFLYNGKKFYILDFNPRFGGGYPFTHEFGFNYIEKILSLISLKKQIYNLKHYKYKKNFFSKGISIYKHK
jgi:carbamoyl-phosphate synthase large subunit|tara:strand:- start:507 stop:1448 length:942 start_codon:yes stop_codon:yes gene_type:complete